MQQVRGDVFTLDFGSIRNETLRPIDFYSDDFPQECRVRVNALQVCLLDITETELSLSVSSARLVTAECRSGRSKGSNDDDSDSSVFSASDGWSCEDSDRSDVDSDVESGADACAEEALDETNNETEEWEGEEDEEEGATGDKADRAARGSFIVANNGYFSFTNDQV